MTLKIREIYRSAPNGDRWLLVHDTETKRVLVRHEPNQSSGGEASDSEVAAFLLGGAPDAPERRELLRLISTLV